jgi:pimeloyl-ACP methyl ester carboxylesterase
MTDPIPVVFIHGLWLHASHWDPWMEPFSASGYAPIAPGWPGEPQTVAEARSDPGSMAGMGAGEVYDHFARIIDGLPSPPVVIGHSFGGLFAQKLLGEGKARAAIAYDAAPIKGVLALPPSAVATALIAVRNPANRKRTVGVTREQFRKGFANALSEDESDRLYDAWAMPSPGRPLFQATAANASPRSPLKVDTKRVDRGPLLLIAGGKDRAVPASVTRATAKLYRKSSAVTELHEFADRGHSLVVDSGWREVADHSLRWLAQQGITPGH